MKVIFLNIDGVLNTKDTYIGVNEENKRIRIKNRN